MPTPTERRILTCPTRTAWEEWLAAHHAAPEARAGGVWLAHDAKRPDTRARRIAQFVIMLTAGRTLYP